MQILYSQENRSEIAKFVCIISIRQNPDAKTIFNYLMNRVIV